MTAQLSDGAHAGPSPQRHPARVRVASHRVADTQVVRSPMSAQSPRKRVRPSGTARGSLAHSSHSSRIARELHHPSSIGRVIADGVAEPGHAMSEASTSADETSASVSARCVSES